MKLRALLASSLLFGALGFAAAQAASSIEQTWFFTGENSLTIDVRLASGAHPDWAASTVTLSREEKSGAPGPAEIVALSPAQVTAGADPGVRRIAVTGLKVSPWWPTEPILYRATLQLDLHGQSERASQRIGFRSFTTSGGQLFLNRRPIFLRGFAINPPGRGIPPVVETSRTFAEDYIRYLKSIHVNIIRIPDDPTWYDVCDELGMMVFGGNYSGKVRGHGPESDPGAAARWYREDKFSMVSHHPSLMIYALTNETPFGGEAGEKWTTFLAAIYRQLQPWDPTRLYIANAGYGFGKVGEIDDLHRYWGWYYQSPFTFLHLRDYDHLELPGHRQPITFTESVGNYNGPDGRVNLTPNHKNPLAQLNWTGTAPSDQQGPLEFAHQSLTIREAAELFRRLRAINPKLSGVFPFTILFNHWNTISSFAEMEPKPAARQLALSYSPVLLSWELYTPQVYAGTSLRPIVHVVNDSDDGANIAGAVLDYAIRDGSLRPVATGRLAAPAVPYYATARIPLSIPLPADLATGDYTVWGRLSQNGRTLAENQRPLFIASRDFAATGALPARVVRLFDPAEITRAALQKVGIASRPLTFDAELNGAGPIVVGEDAADRLTASQAEALQAFAQLGGRVVVLRQDHRSAAALQRLLPNQIHMPATSTDDPEYPPPPRPSRDSFNINPERPEHPVFAGLDRHRLEIWSDPSGWDESQAGFPQIYPVTDGLVLSVKSDVRTTAILADYSQDLEGIALAEFHTGEGSVMYSAFSLAAHAGVDPAADRLLVNLIAYASAADGHERAVLIDAPIQWGKYETEHGVLTGCYSGLMLNSRPALAGNYRDLAITVTNAGHEFAGGPEGWNSRPDIVYVPFGRRPFGPYLHRGWSGVPEPEDPASPEGSGEFWCRIPAGKAQAVHRIFNPSGHALTVHVGANGRVVSAEIAGGATRAISVPLDAGTSVVDNTVRGDRRLVLLETEFIAPPAGPAATPREEVLQLMHRVADWQLANPPPKVAPTDWIVAAFYAGLMAVSDLPGGAPYREAMRHIAEGNQWKLGPLPYDADDHCVGQVYAEMYLKERDPRMIADLKTRFDFILAHPSEGSLDFDKAKNPSRRDRWSWCDSLFMAPPTWIRLYAATGDTRYRDFMVAHWWKTSDYLYDSSEHLFYRDSTFFDRREANGKKVFWARGNGWVLAGLTRVLAFLPANDPARPRFEQQYREMAARILELQQPDGLWRTSLLDPAAFPQPESSGTGFFCYGLAWGVNHGLLDRAKYWPAVERAWAALTGCIAADGKLIHVQSVAGSPKSFPPNVSMPYGVGAFLLAGKEIYDHAP